MQEQPRKPRFVNSISSYAACYEQGAVVNSPLKTVAAERRVVCGVAVQKYAEERRGPEEERLRLAPLKRRKILEGED